MARLRDRGDPTPDITTFQRLVAKAILTRRGERIVSNQGFPGYRANIVAYAVSKLSYGTAQRLDLDAIWQTQELPDAVEEALSELAHVAYRILVDKAPRGANVTEWSKQEGCWKLMKEESWSVPPALEPLLVARGRASNTAGPARPTVANALVRYLSDLGGDFWLTISNWAKETDNLNPWQRRFAYTIGVQLKRGRDLSQKQAAQAERIIQAAAEKGFPVPERPDDLAA